MPDGTQKKPWGSYRDSDFHVTVFDEMVEELISRSEPSGIRGKREDVLKHPFVRDLRNKFNAEIKYLGLAYDLLALRPEVCFAVIIHDPDWRRTVTIKLTDEEYAAMPGQLTSARVDDMAHCLDRMPPESTLPPSAAAFFYGIDAAKELLGIQRDT